MRDLLTKSIVYLIDNERFYAELILGMNISLSRVVPTAGVYIKNGVNLVVNPDFYATLSLDEQVAVLKHECQHILYDHIPRSKIYAPEIYAANKDAPIEDKIINSMKHKVMNVAMDCAINPGIMNITKDGVFPKNFDLRDYETFEWYAENLKDNEKLKQLVDYDGHDLWAKSEEDLEILKEKIRQHVNQAASKTRNAGKMTSENELIVDRLNHVPKDWRGDLKRFVARQTDTVLESSRKKRNRRYGVSYPGVVKWERLTLGVALDTSGSISDEQLNQFMSEVAQIAKYATVIVVEADTEIKNRYVFDPNKKYTVAGRGGTAYQPAFDHFTKNEQIDGLIYFGDMDCYDTPELKMPKYPVLWAITGEQQPPAPWGSKTSIEVKTK